MSDTQTWKNFLSVEDVRGVADVNSAASNAMQSQYSHARKMTSLGHVFHKEIDASELLNEIAKSIASMDTAKGTFLDWFGVRVGVDRFLTLNGKYVRFDDDYYRFLLNYRALCNISDSTAATMNKHLSMLTSTRVFVVDYQDMSIQSIVIIGSVSELQAMILQTYGLLNRPAGVMTNFLIIYPDEKIFGFEKSSLMPFNQGVFNPGRTVGA